MKALLLAVGLLASTYVSAAQAREELPAGCVIMIDETYQEVMVCPK